MVKATCHLVLGQFREGYEAASGCLRIDPGNTEALALLWRSLLWSGLPREAFDVFNGLVARKPEDGSFHLLAAEALTRLHLSGGRPHISTLNTIHEALPRAGNLNADQADTHCRAGDAYRDLSLFTHAEAAYHRALELEPRHEGAVQEQILARDAADRRAAAR